MILDIFISVVLLIFILFPKLLKSMNTPVGKLIFLFLIFLIMKQNNILGFVAGCIFMIQLFQPTESIPKHKSNPSLLPIDETIRPKSSNLMSVARNSVAPPGEEISGSIAGPVANNTLGSYTQINL